MIRKVVAALREVIGRGAVGALVPVVTRPQAAAERLYRPPGARNPLRRALSDQRMVAQTFRRSPHARAAIGQVSYPQLRDNMDAARRQRNPGAQARRTPRFRQ